MKKWMRIPLWLLFLSEFQFELDSDKDDWRQARYQQDSSSDTQTTANELPLRVRGAFLKKAYKHPPEGSSCFRPDGFACCSCSKLICNLQNQSPIKRQKQNLKVKKGWQNLYQLEASIFLSAAPELAYTVTELSLFKVSALQ